MRNWRGLIFSGGPGEVPVGKSVSLQLPAYIYMHGLTNKYRILRQPSRPPKVQASKGVWGHTPGNCGFLEAQINYFPHFEEFSNKKLTL